MTGQYSIQSDSSPPSDGTAASVGRASSRRQPVPTTLVVPCADLDRTIGDLGRSGFLLTEIGPADAPDYAVVERDGLRLRLDRSAFDSGERTAVVRLPDLPVPADFGPGVELALDGPAPAVTPPVMQPALTVSRAVEDGWHSGRAGMRYRDLIPDRWGGSVIASHINIVEGGPVPDYVHYHDVEFQLIFCHRGWVRVVYQDQGDPFVLRPGDAVLQAPGIRHRVLESSPDLSVVEISSPADHPTYLDHELELPNGVVPGRRYGGQDYVHHRSEQSEPEPVADTGLAAKDLGLHPATGGRLHGYVIEPASGSDREGSSPTVEPVGLDHLCPRHSFTLLVMLDGSATVGITDGRTGSRQTLTLDTDDSLAIPAHLVATLAAGPDFERALLVTGTPAGAVGGLGSRSNPASHRMASSQPRPDSVVRAGWYSAPKKPV